MRASRVIHELEEGRKQGKEFIRWWRNENDFVDFELIDRYLQATGKSAEIENFELLNKEEMWTILTRWKPEGLRRYKTKGGEKIEWHHLGKDGQDKTYSCPYNARTIMSIFDTETQGDTIE